MPCCCCRHSSVMAACKALFLRFLFSNILCVCLCAHACHMHCSAHLCVSWLCHVCCVPDLAALKTSRRQLGCVCPCLTSLKETCQQTAGFVYTSGMLCCVLKMQNTCLSDHQCLEGTSRDAGAAVELLAQQKLRNSACDWSCALCRASTILRSMTHC